MIKASNPEELADGRAQGEMALDEEVPQVKHSAVHNTGVHRNKAVEGLSSWFMQSNILFVCSL